MKTFEEYLDKMGYSWNDFDRTNEMENLIEQYADEKVKQALSIANVVGRSEQLLAFCEWLSERDFTCDMTSPEDWVEMYIKSK